MKYRETSIDAKLRDWFTKDLTKRLLREIKLETGTLRGLTPFRLSIDFPILALSGKNGAGKSTLLALACCAYHNEASGYRRPKRNLPYYTFSDFFIQHPNELSPQGIVIRYKLAHDGWRKSESHPDGVGIGTQRRSKKKGGKWNDYDKRINRNVVFLGIDRIVPHAERSPSRSYSRVFKEKPPKGWEEKVRTAVGEILGKKYDDFRYLEHSKYSLPIVTVGKTVYSGFNMGAGENALFEIFSVLHDCGKGALLVIDEIELGLHAEAQRRFIKELKKTCHDLHAQVICTTHSREIFEQLPNDARCFVETVNGKTKILDAISSEYAFSKLSGVGSNELNIFVEDDVAKSLLIAALPAHHRTRISISVIGSSNCLARQLAAVYRRKDKNSVLAVFDGDQRTKEVQLVEHARNMAEITRIDERGEFNAWVKGKIGYLPGDAWPEAWLMEAGKKVAEDIATLVGSDSDSVVEALTKGEKSGKHGELHGAGMELGLERESFMQIIAGVVARKFSDDFAEVVNQIGTMLN
jgi:energy-coupling factor transporter ATP-binding protein EcfA2